jgi:hypothetical protein
MGMLASTQTLYLHGELNHCGAFIDLHGTKKMVLNIQLFISVLSCLLVLLFN